MLKPVMLGLDPWAARSTLVGAMLFSNDHVAQLKGEARPGEGLWQRGNGSGGEGIVELGRLTWWQALRLVNCSWIGGTNKRAIGGFESGSSVAVRMVSSEESSTAAPTRCAHGPRTSSLAFWPCLAFCPRRRYLLLLWLWAPPSIH